MVEMMVGILIGMIVIVVVYNVLSVAERYKRTAIGASETAPGHRPADPVRGRPRRRQWRRGNHDVDHDLDRFDRRSGGSHELHQERGRRSHFRPARDVPRRSRLPHSGPHHRRRRRGRIGQFHFTAYGSLARDMAGRLSSDRSTWRAHQSTKPERIYRSDSDRRCALLGHRDDQRRHRHVQDA